jgi:Na(+)-translocating NADH:ubiquinone oxidoreductase F subunit
MTVVAQNPYALTPENRERAIGRGLVSATWYTTPVPRERMRELLLRRNGPAVRDTLLWFGLLIGSGIAGFLLWGSWWAILPFLVYGVIYGSSSDSRWHECLHGTAFKTDWMNNALYEIASFMVVRESTPWRWSHMRHHSDTIIVGQDPEIAVPRPPDIKGLLTAFFILKSGPIEFRKMVMHALGKLAPGEDTYIPDSEHRKVFFKARVYLLIYGSVIGLSVATGSFLPLMYIGLPSFYGAWLVPIFGLTQHACLAENVLDHRLNCRTVYMNPVFRYLYWNMNYHVEHHMFPLVPYHAQAKLHELVKHDCPKPYNGVIETYREIIPALLHQVKDPTYYVERILPETASGTGASEVTKTIVSDEQANDQGWVAVCGGDALQKEDVLRFDHANKTYAVYRIAGDTWYATDGLCTHGNTHLADGMVIGDLIECPKHNGRFDVRDGSPQRPPVCSSLQTYPVAVRDEKLWLQVESDSLRQTAESKATHTFRVVSNDNVATYIKELILEPVDGSVEFSFQPGDYLKFNIPAYDMKFHEIDVKAPYAESWREEGTFECRTLNTTPTRRNYSMASNPDKEDLIRFNVRIATPPPGWAGFAGVGSSYVFNLKPGDRVTAIGPFGDFHIKSSDREMIYLGGGSGMAPLRAHIAYLFETLKTPRPVSFWYGARSRQDIFYQDYFEALAKEHDNFTFHVALSEPQPQDNWSSHTGFIHEVLQREYLGQHRDPTQIEYYLCGPPQLIKAGRSMLASLEVDDGQIAFDEF